MSNKIYPLAYKLSPGQTCMLYYLGFPDTWKASLLEIARNNNPRFKDEYGLPTDPLKKLVESWMEGIIALAPLKKGSCDEHWLTSSHEYSEKDIQVLCNIIKVWVKATYVTSSKVSAVVRKQANDFCGRIQAESLMALQSKAECRLTLEDGTVCEEAYQAVPLLALNRLLGREIVLNGQTLRFCYAAKNQLISQPVTASGNQHQYSFVFDFSVQTTPPRRKALLLCQMSIRRWIYDSSKERVPFLSENVNAHIKISQDKYCQVPIMYDYSTRQFEWKEQDRECYNIWGYEQLPMAKEVIANPAKYADRISLPYKNGMGWVVTSKIETGVSVVDKAFLYQKIAVLLDSMVCEQPEAERISRRGQNISVYRTPQEYESREEFRKWVSNCVETDQIAFELYGLWSNSDQQDLLTRIQEKIQQDFGENEGTSCLNIQCLRKEVGDFADGMPDNRKATKISRCEEIVERLGQADQVTACIFALPAPKYYTGQGDPKPVLRNAFARTGRIVQFVIPDGDINQNKIENTVYDLYRQLGIVTLLDFRKRMPDLAAIPCVGMHLCKQVKGIANKARFLPIYVTVDVLEGKTRVRCDAFSKREVSYREACLEMAGLFWKNDLEQCCVNASRSPAKQKLIELKSRYYKKEGSVLLVIQSDGDTRYLWSGISDKEIGGYAMTDRYCPEQINAGESKNPYMISLVDSGIRIMRIRSNQEVPDYYTELSKKSADDLLQYSSVSGMFKYDDVYWGIHVRANDFQYINSFKESKINYPEHRFAEKDMVELYPLQVQPGDDVVDWVFYTNALRHISIQYSQSTVLPLPLHLAKTLEEYLFDA